MVKLSDCMIIEVQQILNTDFLAPPPPSISIGKYSLVLDFTLDLNKKSYNNSLTPNNS